MSNKRNGAAVRPAITIDIQTGSAGRRAMIELPSGAQVLAWQDYDTRGRWSKSQVGMSWPGTHMRGSDEAGLRQAEELADAIKLMAAQVREWIGEAE